MNCRNARIYIDESARSETLMPAVSTHLAMCAVCKSYMQQTERLQELLDELPQVCAPSDFNVRLAARSNVQRLGKGGGTLLFPGFPILGQMTVPLLALVAFSVMILLLNAGDFRGATGGSVLLRAESVRPAGNSLGDVLSSISGSLDETVFADTSQANRVAASGSVTPKKRNSVAASSRTNEAFKGRLRSNDYALESAPVLLGPERRAPDGGGFIGQIVEVEIPDYKMNILIGEPQGELRRVALRRVTFGSQQILDRPQARPVYVSSSQGIW
jgi:hypothetical protein